MDQSYSAAMPCRKESVEERLAREGVDPFGRPAVWQHAYVGRPGLGPRTYTEGRSMLQPDPLKDEPMYQCVD
jgi:hypothetical protein